MTHTPVLMLPNFQEDFIIETDASGQGMGVVLMQNNHPICYFSKKFCPKLLSASTYVRELHAITAAVKKWRTYLLGRKFIIHTDQRNLRELMTQVVQTPEQQYYLSKLLGYTYEIMYKLGSANRVADALSRLDESLPQMMWLTVPQCELVTKIQEIYSSNSTLKHLYQQVLRCPEEYPGFKVVKGILLCHDKIFIPYQSPLKQVLLDEFHATPMAGHAGIHRTYGQLSDNFYWKGMKKDVAEFVKGCVVCQQIKSPTQLPYGLLQPIPPPMAVWEDISLDFITGLPSFQSYSVIWWLLTDFLRQPTLTCFQQIFQQLRLLNYLLPWCASYMACLKA